MTTINSKLLLASLNSETGDILYTFEWTFPRIILPEILTHRALSRNTSSSRAIPNKLQRRRVWEDPFVPCYIGARKAGMQAGGELDGWKRTLATGIWKGSRLGCLMASWAMDKLGVHKQISSRLVEPWTWTKQLVSFTDINNLLRQRANEMAEPHFQDLAYQVQKQVDWIRNFFADPYCRTPYLLSNNGLLQRLEPGQWHLPYVDYNDKKRWDLETVQKLSAARCARVSYQMPGTDRKSIYDEDIALFDRLAGSDPKHLSPLEHPAMALWPESEQSGNFRGWKQLRKQYE